MTWNGSRLCWAMGDFWGRASCVKPYLRQPVEISILRPDDSAQLARRRVYDAIGERQLVLKRRRGRPERQCGIQIDDAPLLHDGHRLQGIALATVSGDDLEDFQQAHGRCHQPWEILDGRSEVVPGVAYRGGKYTT